MVEVRGCLKSMVEDKLKTHRRRRSGVEGESESTRLSVLQYWPQAVEMTVILSVKQCEKSSETSFDPIYSAQCSLKCSPPPISYTQVWSHHILCSKPWYGLHTPLTLSLALFTGFRTRFNFSPLAFFSNSTFCWISLGSIFRTQITFSRPLMYRPRTTGWRPGRGETVTSMPEFCLANLGRLCLRNALRMR